MYTDLLLRQLGGLSRKNATTEPDPIAALTPNWFIVFVAAFARSPVDPGVASLHCSTNRFGGSTLETAFQQWTFSLPVQSRQDAPLWEYPK